MHIKIKARIIYNIIFILYCIGNITLISCLVHIGFSQQTDQLELNDSKAPLCKRGAVTANAVTGGLRLA